MRLRRGVLMAGGLLLVYSMMVFSQGSQAKDSGIEGASDSSGPRGTLALVETLRSCQMAVSMWEHPAVLLPGQSDTLLSIEPSESAYPIKQAQSVLNYARSGHQVIWVTEHQDKVISALGIKLHTLAKPSDQKHRTITGPNLPDRFEPVSFSSNVSIDVLPKTPGVRSYKDDNQEVLGAVVPVGHGDVSVWVAPEVFENGSIGQAHNFAIPFALVNQSSLLIDEYGHGVEQGTLFQTVFGHGRQISFVFLLISAILYLWSSCVRLGSPKRASDDLPRHTGELMDALAWHFSKRSMQSDVMNIASRGVKKRICNLLSCHPSSDWELIDTYAYKHLNLNIQGIYQSWRMATNKHPNMSSRELKKYKELTRKLISALDVAKKNG